MIDDHGFDMSFQVEVYPAVGVTVVQPAVKEVNHRVDTVLIYPWTVQVNKLLRWIVEEIKQSYTCNISPG